MKTVCSNEQTQPNELVRSDSSMKQQAKEKRLKEINRRMEEHWNSEEFQESKKSHVKRLSEN